MKEMTVGRRPEDYGYDRESWKRVQMKFYESELNDSEQRDLYLDRVDVHVETFWSGGHTEILGRNFFTRWTIETTFLCFVHLVDHFGKDRPVKSLWVPEIKEYVAERLEKGSAPSTVNREKGTLSKLFQVLVELRRIDANPVRLVKNLSQKSEEREVYLSYTDFTRMLEETSKWFRPIAQTAYYTGMRRREILSLTRSQVRLGERMRCSVPRTRKNDTGKGFRFIVDLCPFLKTS
ncbi:MAG: hypothetical protein HY912_16860 [Desulfomonile tiedjei]|uniref:Tyr recombinase domain-containing protein n=1 Tax=Desulfomonile tiedjei TaxID=2358 RepID=A0A9D6Z7J0_9BACT|nr:hypothetical protein [Desulfomonile tiedjei]